MLGRLCLCTAFGSEVNRQMRWMKRKAEASFQMGEHNVLLTSFQERANAPRSHSLSRTKMSPPGWAGKGGEAWEALAAVACAFNSWFGQT